MKPLTLILLAMAVAPPAFAAKEACLSSRGRNQRAPESRCESLQVGGLTRTYRLYVPPTLRTPRKPAPLLFALHGGGGSGAQMELMTHGDFNRIADRDGAIVVYPDGIGRSWNDGRNDIRSKSREQNVDDVGFIRALVHELSSRYPVDAKRVYATGMSNGGFMSYRLACDAADIFAAIAPVASNLSAALGPRCTPSKPVSVVMMNGTDDPLVPWKGGPVRGLGLSRGKAWSTEHTFETWALLDGCTLRSDDQVFDKSSDDPTSVVLHVRSQCKANTEVRLYEIRGGGHNWPKGEKLGERMAGRVTTELDGVKEIWAFLSAHSAQ